MSESESRFSRQDDLVPQQALADLQVTVIGVGAIGRQVALQLAAIGARRLQLVDFDVVEWTNVTTQGYLQADVGQPKVAATAQAIQQIEPASVVEQIEDRYRPKHATGQAIFCCVDSISARAAIWRSAGSSCGFWCDGRMLGEVMRVFTVAEGQGREHYPATLFEQSEAHVGRCTARSTIYTANIASGLMLHQFCRWLRKMPVDADLSLNLLASDLMTTRC